MKVGALDRIHFATACFKGSLDPPYHPGHLGDLRIWGQRKAILALPLLRWKWVVMPARDPTSLPTLPSWVLHLHLRGPAAAVPSHLPSHRLYHGLADQGLRG